MWNVLGEMWRLTAFFYFPFLVLKSSCQNGSNKIKQEERNKEEIIKSLSPSPSSNLCRLSPLISSANITLVAGNLLVQETCVSQ